MVPARPVVSPASRSEFLRKTKCTSTSGQCSKKLHKGGSDSAVMQELHMATDFAFRSMKVMAWALGQVMSTLVAQECHLWLRCGIPTKSLVTWSMTLAINSWQSRSRRKPSNTSCLCMILLPPSCRGPALCLPVTEGTPCGINICSTSA